MTRVARISLRVGVFLCLFLNGLCAVVFSDNTKGASVVPENKCIDLDLENVSLLNDLANCKQEKGLQAITEQSLRDKLQQLDELNQTIRDLTDRNSEMRGENAKLVELYVRLEERHKNAINQTAGLLDQLARMVVRAHFEKKDLLTSLQNLETERTALQRDNEKYVKFNTQLADDRQHAIMNAKGLLEKQAQIVDQAEEQKKELLVSIQNLEAEKTALQTDKEKLAQLNAQLVIDRQLAVSKADGLLAQQAQVVAQSDAQKKELLVSVQNLEAEKFALQSEKDKLAKLNAQLTNDRQLAVDKVEGLLGQQAQIVSRAEVQKNELLMSLQSLEAEKAALQAEKDKLAKLNVQFLTDRQQAISKSEELVAQQAQVVSQADVQKMDLLTSIKKLEAERTVLQADKEKLLKLNAQLTNDRQLAVSKVEGVLEQQAQVVSQAEVQKRDLLTSVKNLESERDALQADNERLAKLNAKLVTDQKLAVVKAKEIVSQHAEHFIRQYSRQLDSTKDVNKLEANITALKAENARISKINSQLESKGKEFFLKASECEYTVKGCDGLSQAAKGLNSEVVMLKQENNLLKSKLNTVEKNYNMEKASIYREVGAACAQVGLLEQAINDYQASLKLDPDDPMTHYYLGLLYSKKRMDKFAVIHFKKYLTLAPLAENREEVEYFMSNLLGQSKSLVK